MDEQTFVNLVAGNLVKYRKAHNFTQSELAQKINYSDKAVSKWERGDCIPDTYTLQQIADIYGITLNDLLSRKRSISATFLLKKRLLIPLLSCCGVWILFTVAFAACYLFQIEDFAYWLLFIYAIPTSAVVMIVFSSIWLNKPFLFSSISVFLWTLALSVHLSMIDNQQIPIVYAIAASLQIFAILWFVLFSRKKKL